MLSSAHLLLLVSVISIAGGALVIHAGTEDVVGEGAALAQPDRAATIVAHPPSRDAPDDRPEGPRRKPPAPLPSPDGLAAAQRYAGARGGLVSFAAIDADGRLYGRDLGRLYSAASTVKAMLLAAEVQRLETSGLPIDAGTDGLLRSMITRSDNRAADAIYERVGDPGMFAVAERAGMTGFTEAGHWGNAQISAADLAWFYFRLDRVFAGPHREYALGLLGSVTPTHAWGIPAAAGEDWAVRFKGGWLPDRALAHQGAQLRERDGDRELAVAVLTDAQPSHEYATETIRGVAARLMGGT